MTPMGTMARLYFTNPPVSDRELGSDTSRASHSVLHYRGCSRVGGRVHRNLVARVKHGSEPGENLGHRRGEHHVPGRQEKRWYRKSVFDILGQCSVGETHGSLEAIKVS